MLKMSGAVTDFRDISVSHHKSSKHIVRGKSTNYDSLQPRTDQKSALDSEQMK